MALDCSIIRLLVLPLLLSSQLVVLLRKTKKASIVVLDKASVLDFLACLGARRQMEWLLTNPTVVFLSLSTDSTLALAFQMLNGINMPL